MVPYYNSKWVKEVVYQFYKENTQYRENDYMLRVDQWCRENLADVNGRTYTYEDVVTAKPDELYDISRIWTQNLESKRMDFEVQYIKDNLYGNMNKTAQKILFDFIGTKVCPYCNRNYVFADNRIKGCDYDHFYPKGQFPLLAASFYNLIPVCPICNRRKSDKPLEFYPYKKYGYNDLPHFIIRIMKTDYLTNNKSLKIDLIGNSFEGDIGLLELNTLYQSHVDIVQDILIRKKTYSGRFIEELRESFKNMNINLERVEELLFDLPSSPEKFGEKPLSKLKYEIWHSEDI